MADYERSDQYFATLDGEELIEALMDKVTQYYDYCRDSGLRGLWQKSWNFFYRALEHGGDIYTSGEQDEYETLHVNHYRNLLRHILITVTSPRPQFEPRATNTDYRSQAQTFVARGLLDYYLKEKRVGKNAVKAVETALVFTEGFISTGWDPTMGDEIKGPETEFPSKTGDMFFHNHTPLDVIRDFLREDPSQDWYIVRTFRNRFDLAAQYEELADKILEVDTKSEEYNDKERRTRYLWSTKGESDDIPVYTFYHRQSNILPEGRMVSFVDNEDTVLIDTALPYKQVPVYRVSAADIIMSIFGYSDGLDLLNIQDALDTMYSTILTNNSAFGVQSVACPRGANVSVEEVTDGLKLLFFDGEKAPEAMQLTQTAKETYTFLDRLEQEMETLSGVNSVTRGNPEASLESGAALALVQAQTLQFMMDLQRSYTELLEDLGTAIVNINRVYAESARTISIAGKYNKSNLLEFKGEDVSEIDRVTVDVGNPLTNSRAGQINLAEKMLESGLIKTPEEFLAVIETGRHEPLIEHDMNELMCIRAENEILREGKFLREPNGENVLDARGQPMVQQQVRALITDDHRLHILEHKGVLSDPHARNNPDIVQAVTQHIQEHIMLAQTMDPQLAAMLGYAPPANAPGQPNVQGQGPLPQALDASNPLAVEAGKVNMPQMPNNPLTGQQYDTETGGLPNVGVV